MLRNVVQMLLCLGRCISVWADASQSGVDASLLGRRSFGCRCFSVWSKCFSIWVDASQSGLRSTLSGVHASQSGLHYSQSGEDASQCGVDASLPG